MRSRPSEILRYMPMCFLGTYGAPCKSDGYRTNEFDTTLGPLRPGFGKSSYFLVLRSCSLRSPLRVRLYTMVLRDADVPEKRRCTHPIEDMRQEMTMMARMTMMMAMMMTRMTMMKMTMAMILNRFQIKERERCSIVFR